MFDVLQNNNVKWLREGKRRQLIFRIFSWNYILSLSNFWDQQACWTYLEYCKLRCVQFGFKVHLTPRSLHLSETHCALLNLILTFSFKVTKSSHYLFHDRASKGHGSIPGLRLQKICIAVSLCKHACKEVCDVKPRIDPCILLAWSWSRWWLDFVTFTSYKKSRFSLKRRKAFRTGTEIYLSEKIFWG